MHGSNERNGRNGRNERNERSSTREEERGGLSPARILVVEDNALNRLLLRDILALRGHQVAEAATVEEARILLCGQPFDLVLLDVQIPGGGGEAVVREVRRRAPPADLPIVAVTSLAMPGDRERLLRSGFQGYLSKPIDTRAFGPIVETYLRVSAAARAAAASGPALLESA